MLTHATTAERIEQHRMMDWRGRSFDEDDRSNWDPPTATTRETDSRHGHWRHQRRAVETAFRNGAANAKRLDRFLNCGSCAVVEWSEEQQRHRITCWHCRDRMCQPCQKKRQRELRNIISNNAGATQTRFVTLTLKHADEALKSQVRRLRRAFNRLKRSKPWKRAIDGGVCILEVKRLEPHDAETDQGIKYRTDGLWHVHFHIVCTGSWIDRDALCAEWYAITGDSWDVDVRLCRDPEKAGHYLSKYVTKGTNAEVYGNQTWLTEFIEATKGSRVYNVFGKWKSMKEDADETPEATDWRAVCSVHELHEAAHRGERWAIELYRKLHRGPADLHRSQKPRPQHRSPP